jgi:quercetin dioxygenase-like cupin family protein
MDLCDWSNVIETLGTQTKLPMKTKLCRPNPVVRLTLAITLAFSVVRQSGAEESTRVRQALVQSLPALAAGHLTVKLIEVTYPPGGSSAPHRHPYPVLVYVLSGGIRARVQGQPERTYKAGEVFYEAPNQIHAVSANASRTEPARFLACFICDHDGALGTPVNDTIGGRGYQ